MDNTYRILNRGGFMATLLCFLMAACGPDSGMDSGTPPMSDAYVPPGTDAGMPDAHVSPIDDSGVDEDDAAMMAAECTPAEVAARMPGCGEQYDLLTGMEYTDSAMPAACMETFLGPNWGTAGTRGCFAVLFREAGTNHQMLTLDCPGAGDRPYDGQYRLAPDGRFLGNCGNRDLIGEAGNCGILTPDPGCRNMLGEFFHGGESTPYRTQGYWME